MPETTPESGGSAKPRRACRPRWLIVKTRTETYAFLGGVAAVAVSAIFALAIGAVVMTLVETGGSAVDAEWRFAAVPLWIQVSVTTLWFGVATLFFLAVVFQSVIFRIVLHLVRTASLSKSIHQVTRRIVEDIQGH